MLSLKYFKFRIPYKDIAKMTIFIIANLLLFYFLKDRICDNWIYNVLILCVIGFAVAFIIRLIQIKDILYVLKNED